MMFKTNRYTKKIRFILWFCIIFSFLISWGLKQISIYAKPNSLQYVNLNIFQRPDTEKYFKTYDIKYDSATKSTNKFIKENDFMESYDLYNSDKIVCTVILMKDNKSIVALLDENKLIFGIVDNTCFKDMNLLGRRYQY